MGKKNSKLTFIDLFIGRGELTSHWELCIFKVATWNWQDIITVFHFRYLHFNKMS